MDWVPEIQEALKDKALSILGDRFKIEYIAESLSRSGVTDPKDVIKFIMDSYGMAQQIHPKYMPMDALYKAMRDGQITTTGALR